MYQLKYGHGTWELVMTGEVLDRKLGKNFYSQFFHAIYDIEPLDPVNRLIASWTLIFQFFS